MNLLFFNGLLLLGLSMTTIPDTMVLGSTPGLFPEPPRNYIPNKCITTKAYGLIQTSCKHMELREVPKGLKPSVQILDLTHNRIRNLYNNTFERYPNIAFLYMPDNLLSSIEEGAFSNLYYLETLDLIMNGLAKFPKSLFHLPYFRKFYASDNYLVDGNFDGSISSPITHLFLSSNTLTRIPDLGTTSDLIYLNVSNNKISSVTIDDIAPFCQLKILDLRHNDITFDSNSCDCQLFEVWVKEFAIDAKVDFTCHRNAEICQDLSFSNETLALRSNCTQIIKDKNEAKRARSTWILVASLIAVFSLVVFLVLCCIHKKNKKKRLRLKAEQQISKNNANTELLHNQHST